MDRRPVLCLDDLFGIRRNVAAAPRSDGRCHDVEMPDAFGPLLAQIDERSRRIDEIVRQAANGERDQLDEVIDTVTRELSGRGGGFLVEPQMNVLLAGLRADRAALYLGRYLRDDRLDDLVEAVADMETVFEWLEQMPWIELGPSLTARYHWLLGSALAEQFDHTAERSSLNRAMELFEVAAGEQRAESRYLASLAFARMARYEHAGRHDELGALDDLDDAIDWLGDAIERLPPGDVNRGPWLSSLSAMWRHRFDRDYDVSNLDRAVECAEAALESVTSKADRVAALRVHGAAKRVLYQHHRLDDDLDAGLESLTEAIEIGRESPSRFGLVAARDAAQWALERGDHDGAVVAGEAGLAILRGMNTRQRVPSHAEPWLRVGVGLAADTAWAMVAMGNVTGAALTLEHSRTTVLSALLPDPGGDTLTDEDLLAIGATIPLCYLAMWTKGAFALVVDEHGVRAVALDGVDVTAAKDEFRSHWYDVVLGRGATDIHRTCRDVGGSDDGIDSSRPTPSRRDAIGHLVDWLDDAVMGPLADEIGGRAAVLIPTGPFAGLPLHAGSVNGDSDVRWTFAPSARALRRARARAATCTDDALLAVVDPSHNRTPPLPGAATEVAEIAPLYAEQRILTGPTTDAEAVLGALTGCDVVHFACHGRGDVRDPMNSALLLAGADELVLRELIGEVAFDGIRLAVLSACETNVTSWTLPDEAVSFASGLLHAGAAGVIGSLWAVPDHATRHLMVEFHRRWRSSNEHPSDALSGAQRAMRTGELGGGAFTHPENWAGFVYIGA
jgi:tetratricopeptide (TPR) repeat protein